MDSQRNYARIFVKSPKRKDQLLSENRKKLEEEFGVVLEAAEEGEQRVFPRKETHAVLMVDAALDSFFCGESFRGKDCGTPGFSLPSRLALVARYNKDKTPSLPRPF